MPFLVLQYLIGLTVTGIGMTSIHLEETGVKFSPDGTRASLMNILELREVK